MIDVVSLVNGSIVKGIVTEIIPSDTVKIKTSDGSTFVYQFDEVESITKVEKIERVTEPINKVTTKQKNPMIALGSGCGAGFLSGFLPAPIPPILGVGQFYNGEYTKGLIFLGVGAITAWDIVELANKVNSRRYPFDVPTDEEAIRMVVDIILFSGSVVWSTFDSYYSAKRINLEAEKKEVSSTSLDYIPNQGMMASYRHRF